MAPGFDPASTAFIRRRPGTSAMTKRGIHFCAVSGGCRPLAVSQIRQVSLPCPFPCVSARTDQHCSYLDVWQRMQGSALSLPPRAILGKIS